MADSSLPNEVSIRWEPLSPEVNAQSIRHYDDFHLLDGREFHLYGEDGEKPAIEELDAAGKRVSWLPFPTQTQAEQVWVDLQAMFGVKSMLASCPDWDGLFPPPSQSFSDLVN